MNKWIKALAKFNLKATEEMIDLVDENRKLKEHIKKLGLRIHNQRVALRENWMITEMRRSEYCGNLRPLKSKWWGYIKKRNSRADEM